LLHKKTCDASLVGEFERRRAEFYDQALAAYRRAPDAAGDPTRPPRRPGRPRKRRRLLPRRRVTDSVAA
jgi:hypothetical protein